MIGSSIGHFRILDRLGRGGMGEVYLAEDTKLGRQVAVKFLSAELSGDAAFSARFLREARAIAALNHPHICTIFETGEHDGRPFFVMEYLEGTTLKEVVEAGPLDQAALERVAMQLADALAAAHGKGILHRDLKPANVMRDARGNIKLLDFGLAKDLHADRAEDGEATASGGPATPLDATVTAPAPTPPELTQTGTTIGTYAYMSPEQLRGEELDQRSDLFALGLILFELATGRPAFTGGTMALLVDAVLNQPVPAAATLRPDLPPQLNAVIRRLTAKNREDRLESAAVVRDAIMLAGSVGGDVPEGDDDQAFLSTLGRKRSPWAVIVGLIGVTILSLAAGLAAPEADAGQLPGLLAVIGLVLIAGGVLIWWREGRRIRRERSEGPLRITRLEEDSSGRIWLYTYIFMWVAAILSTFLLGLAIRSVVFKQGGALGPGDLVFQAVLAVLFWTSATRGRRWRDAPPARKSQEIEIQASYARILSRISAIITDLDAQVTGLNLGEGLIRATTSASLKTWGSRLSFAVTEKDPGVFNVRIVSEPILPFEILEFGRNKDNVRRAIELLVQD